MRMFPRRAMQTHDRKNKRKSATKASQEHRKSPVCCFAPEAPLFTTRTRHKPTTNPLGATTTPHIYHHTYHINHNTKLKQVNFSHADNARSIPSAVDGLKPSQRKLLFGCFKRKLVTEEVREHCTPPRPRSPFARCDRCRSLTARVILPLFLRTSSFFEAAGAFYRV